MRISKSGHLIVETVAPRVQVVRFTHPDLREQLYDDAEIDGCSLFRDVQESVLDTLTEGQTLIFNLGLVEPLPSVFLRYLLAVRGIVQARKGRLVLCRLSKEQKEILQVTRTLQLFPITNTEAQALREAEVCRRLSDAG